MDTDPSIISLWKIKHSLGSCSPFILQVTLQLHDTRGVPQRGGGAQGSLDRAAGTTVSLTCPFP